GTAGQHVEPTGAIEILDQSGTRGIPMEAVHVTIRVSDLQSIRDAVTRGDLHGGAGASTGRRASTGASGPDLPGHLVDDEGAAPLQIALCAVLVGLTHAVDVQASGAEQGNDADETGHQDLEERES